MDIEHVIIPDQTRGALFDTHFLRQNSLKVVIQEIYTRRYWGSAGVWTLDMALATTFTSRSDALEAAINQKLRNVQLVLSREFRELEVAPIETSSQLSPGDDGTAILVRNQSVSFA